MKRVLYPRYQRVFGVVFLILLQLAMFLLLFLQFSTYFIYFYWFCIVLSLLVSMRIANGKGRLPYKVAWIIPICLFPFIGGPAYFLLGGFRRKIPQETHGLGDVLAQHSAAHLRPSDLRHLGVDVVQQSSYLKNAGNCPPYGNTETQYFATGEAFYPVFLDELRNADSYIFLEYFIIDEGEMWDSVLSILKEKAAAGLTVRIIYDGFGSVLTLPKSFPQDMKRLGIEVCIFRPVLPVLSIHQNNRDHRKICVIDGTVGFVGGINIADEYINRVERFGYWKDCALLQRGEAVWSLAIMFLHMWESLSHQQVDYGAFYPKAFPQVAPECGFVQPYFDTPLATDTIGADLHAQMFSKAKWYLYITTPYLIIDETIASALNITARAGVDVRIMTPHIPDKKMVFSITQSHYEPLLRAGVRIYEFLPGFIHSKTVVVDDLYASVGSCNLDYRSFYLQFENGTWLCGSPTVSAIREDFLAALPYCKEITIADCQNVPFYKRLTRSVLRILSPLL